MKKRMKIAFVLCLFSFSLLSSMACYASEPISTVAVLSPAIVVSEPARAFSSIDPLGYKKFKTQYQTRRTMAYVISGEGELHAIDKDNAEGGQTSAGELWAYIHEDQTLKLEYLTKSESESLKASGSSLLDVTYYTFDAKIFDERSKAHPQAWGTLLLVGMGTNSSQSREHSNRCLLFDITDPAQTPSLLAEFKHTSMGPCTSKPTALTLPDAFGGDPLWYLAFGAGQGTLRPGLFFYDLQTMTLDKEVWLRQFRPEVKSGHIAGISAADIDQDGLTDLLYFGTIEASRVQESGSLYSLTFTRSLDTATSSRAGKYSSHRERYMTPQLAKLFAGRGAISHKPLLKRGSEGKVWLFFSAGSSVYGLIDDFSRQRVSEFQLSSSGVKNRGWVRTLPKNEVFTSAIVDLGEIIVLNAFRRDCNDCSESGLNTLKLYHAFSGEEITDILADKKQTRVLAGNLLLDEEGFPRQRIDHLISDSALLSLLAIENKSLYGEESKLLGVELAEGIRRLSWWQR
ncbi:hypothetical protein A3749_04970 [Oleiphilus sp. HI0078]|uniref:hypothetical protein n=1 Tax=unclassified Oleiphilus TaxID=2631174 RepID=UPI0007C39E33|nr:MULTISPECIES: hypothetical protein [unclassified Oleiphilus]KZY39920.1 hypothetical protein A3729_02260 [Oleiphilus sp. HI0043]KZY65215.1 hypothetical protein A3735_08160 [Oleiphilus sp. HI0061]KZY86989.1 hypothetical protein A3743_15640 [Oleiphilus sp. HI0072]KZZ15738.1 hypothetical protein A3749_04970 [Oleiphilus sp. HI0078]